MINHVRSGTLAAVLSGLLLAPLCLAQAPPPPTPIRDGSMPPNRGGDPFSYALLSDPLFDYAAIRRAQVFGLTDDQIGESAALADRTGVPLSEVISRVETGSTFSALADRYGVPPQVIAARVPTYVTLVQDYLAAYSTSGGDTVALPLTAVPAPPPPDGGLRPAGARRSAGGRTRRGRGRRRPGPDAARLPAPPPPDSVDAPPADGGPNGGPPPPPNGGPPPPLPE